MAQRFNIVFVILVFLTNLLLTSAFTVPSDVLALGSLYGSLTASNKLTGWRLVGGDPCGSESWRGVTCSGPRVVSVNISGLGVDGNLDLANIADFTSLNELDLSNNNIIGSVPAAMPPKATHIDLSRNNLVGSLPYPFPFWKHLKYLNVSHNMLYGPINEVFDDLHRLEKLDLSFNNFRGDLPISMAMLTNIHELHLENNHFTGSVGFMANLPFYVLHIEHNFFSGPVPTTFQSIPDLGMDDNCFRADDIPSPVVIVQPLPLVDPPLVDQSSPSPSAAQNISPSPEVGGVSLEAINHKRLGMGAMAGIICGVFLAVILVTVAIVVYVHRSLRNNLDSRFASAV